MVSTLTDAIARLEDQLELTTKNHAVMMAIAAENLAQSEAQICNTKQTMSAVYSDAFATIEKKMEVLTRTMESMMKMSDVEQGGTMRGSSSRQSVHSTPAPSVSGISSRSSISKTSRRSKGSQKPPPSAAAGSGGRL